MISINRIKQIIEKEEEGPTLDYKEDLVLNTDGDKAELIKDIVSLANSAKVAHIIIGVEDKTRKPVDLKTSHNATQLNDILKNRCDPPISLEYIERKVLGYKVGVIEIHGENPPYIISVNDRFGGKRTCGESCYINRGTVFVRNNDKNEGASREHIEKFYENKVKYVTVQADLQLSHSSSVTSHDAYKEVSLDFELTNIGDVLADSPLIYIAFKNIERITGCKTSWKDISKLNPKPTVRCYLSQPIGGKMHIGGFTLRVKKAISQIRAFVELYSTNMRNKKYEYIIELDE